MALNPFIARIEKTLDGPTMNEIRVWMDHRKIQPSLFRATANSGAFEILFNKADEAALFEREFPGFVRPADQQA